MNLKLISCEVFYREMCAAIATSPHRVDLEFLPKGLHDLESADMRSRIQSVLDAVDAAVYDAIVFGYGLCNNGLHDLAARTLPIVIPRAHDCITLFFGSRERYKKYFDENPGVYFKTSGWIERGHISDELKPHSIEHQSGMDRSYEELVEQYGEDNAAFLYETLCKEQAPHYRKMTFIEMGVEPDERFHHQARTAAEEKGWDFEKTAGDMTIIRKLVHGDWDDATFLVVQPGERVIARYDDNIIHAAPGRLTEGHTHHTGTPQQPRHGG